MGQLIGVEVAADGGAVGDVHAAGRLQHGGERLGVGAHVLPQRRRGPGQRSPPVTRGQQELRGAEHASTEHHLAGRDAAGRRPSAQRVGEVQPPAAPGKPLQPHDLRPGSHPGAQLLGLRQVGPVDAVLRAVRASGDAGSAAHAVGERDPLRGGGECPGHAQVACRRRQPGVLHARVRVRLPTQHGRGGVVGRSQLSGPVQTRGRPAGRLPRLGLRVQQDAGVDDRAAPDSDAVHDHHMAQQGLLEVARSPTLGIQRKSRVRRPPASRSSGVSRRPCSRTTTERPAWAWRRAATPPPKPEPTTTTSTSQPATPSASRVGGPDAIRGADAIRAAGDPGSRQSNRRA